MAQGISLEDALSLEAEDLEKTLGGLPPDHHHCAVLAISSLRDAVSDYFQNARASWKRLYAR
jgi:nitrogen fixation NifU-like protein